MIEDVTDTNEVPTNQTDSGTSSGALKAAKAPVIEVVVPVEQPLLAPTGQALAVAPSAAATGQALALAPSSAGHGVSTVMGAQPTASPRTLDISYCGDVCLALAIPQIAPNMPVPEAVRNAGFNLNENPACELDYAVDGDDMQVLTVKLKAYQEMAFASHTNLVQRVSAVSLSKTEFGFRLKNMTGNAGVMVQLAPGYIAKIVALSLTEYPELVIEPEVYLAGTDAGLRIVDELRPGFYPYKSVMGTGVVFLKSVGPAMFHVLKEKEACIARTENVLAFQTFCKVEACTIESPDGPGCFSAAARVFPHMKITGPGLVMISPLYPDAKVVPISLDEFPELYIKHEVFMACSDPGIEVEAKRMRRGAEKRDRGEIMYCLHGKGVAFLNISGVCRFQKLQPMETILLTVQSCVAYQSSCKVTQEKAWSGDRNFMDLKISGPGLVIAQSLPATGRKPDRWGNSILSGKKIVPKKPDESADPMHKLSATPTKPAPPGQFGVQTPGPNGVMTGGRKSAVDTE